MKLKLFESGWGPFSEGLRARQDVETAGIILAERIAADVLLGREFLLVPDTGYQIREPDRIRIDPVALNRLIRPARDRGLSIFTVHTHPGADETWFSVADDIGDGVLMPSLFVQTDGPHGSLVVAGDTGLPAARAWLEPDAAADIDVQIVGKSLHVISSTQVAPSPEWFGRQRLALGEDGQHILRLLHVGICGAGGTGSATFVQLVHLGVGEITVVDGDLVEASNVSRVVGATTAAEVPGVPSVLLDDPLPAKNVLIRAIAAKLNLADTLPAIFTAPDKARLVVDTRRGTIWFDGTEIPDLKPDTHPFAFTELLARNAPNAVSKDEVLAHLSPGRSDGDQVARSAKAKAKKAMEEALQGRGACFHDPFRAENGGYRLTVAAYVV